MIVVMLPSSAMKRASNASSHSPEMLLSATLSNLARSGREVDEDDRHDRRGPASEPQPASGARR